MNPANDQHVDTIQLPGWAGTPAVGRVLDAVQAFGGEGRFVGGCVRDTLLGRKIGDIDIASNLSPEDVILAMKQADIHVVPTGLAHGTVTAVVNHVPLEITTLRRDVETDGRHARVKFTDRWSEDAARRDFTMNALYLDRQGRIFDYFGGLSDLRDQKLRFIGAAGDRIAEDHLRILRFFRFSAQLDILPPDPDGLAASVSASASLQTLSRERIWQEMRKLLIAPAAPSVLKIMQATGVSRHLTTGGGELFGPMEPLANLPAGRDALRVLRRILPDVDRARLLAEDWKLSRADAGRLLRMYEFRLPEPMFQTVSGLRRLLYRSGLETFRDLVWLALADEHADPETLMRVAEEWESPKLPVNGQDVMACGIERGPMVGLILSDIEDWWIMDDFQADRSACLAELNRIVARPRREVNS